MKNEQQVSLSAGVYSGFGICRRSGCRIDQPGGGLIYDNVLKITWLQDANYAKTSGYDTGGYMTWDAAQTWAAGLVYGGYSDWRLPTITDTGSPGCDYALSGTDCGYNVDTATSELAYMFHVNLGNLSSFDSSGNALAGSSGVNWGVVNTNFTDAVTSFSTPIQNFPNDGYWSGTEYAPDTSRAWVFHGYDGYQDASVKDDIFYAWAVRPGDVAAAPPSILEPGSLTLVGLGWARRRRG
ncbi:MAG: DUF1566 domain-containing protein [Candidatus Competibacteraceae bacterium]|nr:DUF1566 domain-containing protein [Candidatus Competibacteraceae bacterium]